MSAEPAGVEQPGVMVATHRRGGRWRPGGGVIGLLASAALLAVLYRGLDIRLVGATLARANPLWLLVSVLLILPITFLRGLRFYWVAPRGALPGVGEAFRLTVVSSALNVFLPAKSGDLVKSYFVATRSGTSAGVSVAIVIYERLCDMACLIAWCMVGWVVGKPDVPGLPGWFWPLLGLVGVACGLLIVSGRLATALLKTVVRLLPSKVPRKLVDLASGWPELLVALRGRRTQVVLFSLVLWLAHLCQIWLFTVTLSADVPFTVSASLSAVALMAGQLPLTLAGIGARDVALVLLLARYMPAESAAAMGILIATRNVLPPLFGLPFIGPYMSSILDEARRWRSGTA
jgi:uncharacterized membrane protein YbhN (UPF0104 family)